MWSPNYVQVLVQRARNLIPKGKSGTNDAYAVISHDKEKFQTSTKEQSIDPVWNEECDLRMEDKDTTEIKIVIFHRNLFGFADEFLGQVLIPLKEFLIYERPKSRWFNLEGKSLKKESKYRGELEIQIKFIVKSVKYDEKEKKSNNSHRSLFDIRSALRDTKSESNDKSYQRPESSHRRFSVAIGNKVPKKLISRSFSFKFDTLQTKTKSAFHDMSAKLHNTKVKRSKSEESSKENCDSIILENDINDLSDLSKSEDNQSHKINTVHSAINKKEELSKNIDTKSVNEPIIKKHSDGLLKKALSSNNLFSTIRSSPIDIRGRSSTMSSMKGIHMRRPDIDLEKLVKGVPSKDESSNLKMRIIKNYERRHTMNFNSIPFVYNNDSDKREAQTSPDSMYSSNESIIPSKKPNQRQKYESLTSEELIQLALTQHFTIGRLNDKITELEDYIDKLLVRVIESSPKILQNGQFH